MALMLRVYKCNHWLPPLFLFRCSSNMKYLVELLFLVVAIHQTTGMFFHYRHLTLFPSPGSSPDIWKDIHSNPMAAAQNISDADPGIVDEVAKRGATWPDCARLVRSMLSLIFRKYCENHVSPDAISCIPDKFYMGWAFKLFSWKRLTCRRETYTSECRMSTLS